MKIKDGDGQIVAPPERGRQKGGHGQDDDVGQDIARGDPRHFLKRRAQIARHLRQAPH